MKEIQAGYSISPCLKDLYLYLAENKFPSTESAIHKVKTLAEKCILLDSLLFELIATPEKETVLLAIQEICAGKIITLYHSSLFTGHQVVIKTYLGIGVKFFTPGLLHYLQSYIKGCCICQLSRNGKLPMQTRINLNCIPLSRLSMGLRSCQDYTRDMSIPYVL